MYLGNLSITNMETKLGITFPDELKKIMKISRQEYVNIPIAKGKWHCFDIPFMLVCGDKELTQIIYKNLSPLSSKCKTKLQIICIGGNYG